MCFCPSLPEDAIVTLDVDTLWRCLMKWNMRPDLENGPLRALLERSSQMDHSLAALRCPRVSALRPSIIDRFLPRLTGLPGGPREPLQFQTCHQIPENTHAYSLSCVWFFVTPRTVACQALVSMGFLRQEYWSCHALLQGIYPTQGLNLHLLSWQMDSLLSEPPGKSPENTVKGIWGEGAPFRTHPSLLPLNRASHLEWPWCSHNAAPVSL